MVPCLPLEGGGNGLFMAGLPHLTQPWAHWVPLHFLGQLTSTLSPFPTFHHLPPLLLLSLLNLALNCPGLSTYYVPDAALGAELSKKMKPLSSGYGRGAGE